MLGLLQLVQLILSLLCGLLFWGEIIGKALVITTILIIAGIIYRAGKIKGEKMDNTNEEQEQKINDRMKYQEPNLREDER